MADGLEPCNAPSDVIPDGNGGVLASWSKVPEGSIGASTPLTVADIGAQGTSQADFSVLDVPGTVDDSLVLGDTGAAFATDGNSIVAFNPLTLQTLWTYTSTGGALSFVAATSGGGVTINDSAQGVIQVDSAGNAGAPSSLLRGTSPFLEGSQVAFTDDGLSASGEWAGVVSNQMGVIAGPYLNPALSVFGFAAGDVPQDRQAAQSTRSLPAHPVSFGVELAPRKSDGVLKYTYSWSSSKGNAKSRRLRDLRLCEVGETVRYPAGLSNIPTDNLFFTWPLPMVARNASEESISVPAAEGRTEDSHSPPKDGFQAPYQEAMFAVTQRIWWRCEDLNDNGQNLFVPEKHIVRKVVLGIDGKWIYRVIKNTDSNSLVLPNQ